MKQCGDQYCQIVGIHLSAGRHTVLPKKEPIETELYGSSPAISGGG